MDSRGDLPAQSRQESDARTSIDALTAAFFNAFSSEGRDRVDLSVIEQLFIPEGLLIKNCGPIAEICNLRQFIEPREKMLNDGVLVDFREEELTERTEVFGNVAHRFSLYRKSGVLSGEAFETRGMKTIQFIRTQDGWRMSSLAWDDERDGLSIPDRYV